MDTFTASNFGPLVNAYTISNGNPRTIMVPQASQLAKLQEVTVSGTLFPKQKITLDPTTNQRRITLGSNNGAYTQAELDGDLHFSFGTQQGDPHIACELQNAAAWLSTFNAAIGQDMTVSGFFRCLFEHPGFRSNDDAHIFEIHPVRAVMLGETLHSFDIDTPNPDTINRWTTPRNLNVSDRRVRVNYLKGTTAALKLNQLQVNGTTSIFMICLRNIDLSQALLGRYVINLLAIDIQAA